MQLCCFAEIRNGVPIAKGDAVALVGDYKVTNSHRDGIVFGRADADATKSGEAIPVTVAGLVEYKHQAVNYRTISSTVCMGVTPGFVTRYHPFASQTPRVIWTSEDSSKVHVLH
jgi:hypothetical protein